MTYEQLSREELEEALEEMEKEARELEENAREWEEKAKKARADFENYKKKQEDRKKRWKRQAREELAEDMIEVMDNLERAIMSAEEETTVVKGVKMVSDQLYEALEKRGLERIDAEGEEFDPRHHRAVETVEHDEDDVVVEQKRKGYRFDDKVLREAEVVVGKQDS